jgi:hypothetical protein
MPLVGSFSSRRLLVTLEQLNMNLNFNMRKSAVNEIMPSLDTNGQDLTLEYSLNSPEFYKSVIKDKVYYYWLFGLAVTILLIALYLLKICWTLPRTKDTG